MPRRSVPPIAAALSFVDAINCGDLDRLIALMTDDHTLSVFDEPPVIGLDANRIAIVGHTTGSHLGLPDDEERRQTLIWIVDVVDDQAAMWRLVEDTPAARQNYGPWNAAHV